VLDLREIFLDIWKDYIDNLRKRCINLNDEDDEILWSLNPYRGYEMKVGYKALTSEGIENPPLWWWKIIWKFKFPSK
jgi:hypothetical protein